LEYENASNTNLLYGRSWSLGSCISSFIHLRSQLKKFENWKKERCTIRVFNKKISQFMKREIFSLLPVQYQLFSQKSTSVHDTATPYFSKLKSNNLPYLATAPKNSQVILVPQLQYLLLHRWKDPHKPFNLH
jgi:hypothetical protein